MKKLLVCAAVALAAGSTASYAACTQQEATAKAQELSAKVQELAAKDPNKAMQWMQKVQASQAKYAQMTSYDEACKAYDDLLAELKK